MNFEERNDATTVKVPIPHQPIKRTTALEQVLKYGDRNQAQFVSDYRTKQQREEDHKQGKAQEYVDKQKELRQQTGQIIGIGAGLVGLGLIQGTPIGPYVDAALAAHSGYNLAEQADKGTLGFNTETGLNTLGLLPLTGQVPRLLKKVKM